MKSLTGRSFTGAPITLIVQDFLDSLFTLETYQEEVRESLKACDACPIFPQTTAVGIDMGPGTCLQCRDGKANLLLFFYAKLLASTLLLDTCVQCKTVKDMQLHLLF